MVKLKFNPLDLTTYENVTALNLRHHLKKYLDDNVPYRVIRSSKVEKYLIDPETYEALVRFYVSNSPDSDLNRPSEKDELKSVLQKLLKKL